ncbi:dienelactone hydrolase family protein [uncultured Arthrobacter sp.]|uniref:dienelactone hydrolase family protein n=1 Tax=uncultured Arthrobacter sp. TaxID=114050 RepID=UPI002607187A|nr:dienelactone hydrolase family protein [uncultured Arthrobacter sp.]
MTSLPNPIAGFEDWPDAVRRLGKHPGHNAASAELAQALGVPGPVPTPPVTVHRTSVIDGVELQELGWELPYGPPTKGYLLKPVRAQHELPGVLWLHCHGGNKWLGAERLIDAGDENNGETSAEVTAVQQNLYSGHAVANDLARAGFAVLVHDSFTWGSRRFVLDPPPARVAEGLAARRALWREEGAQPTPAMEYNAAAALHEHTLAKIAGLLGTSYAGMVALEDLAALEVLRNLPGVENGRVGVGGFSGGGGRALVLSALAPEVRAAVVCCMMTTFEGLFPSHADTHSWLLATPGLAGTFDWPELAAINTACRYLVQYGRHDPLFTSDGMHDADALLAALTTSEPGRYTGSWYDAGHVVTPEMLREFISYLAVSLQH